MKKRTIVIDEDKEQMIIGNILEEAFYPNADKVLIIKNYIDKNFVKQEMDSLDENGYPSKEHSVVMISATKQPLKSFNMREFLMLLDDKFHKMISKDKDRKKFLKQVIKDWYNGNIKSNGVLSVNYL